MPPRTALYATSVLRGTIIEEILADEEEHASDLADLLYVVDPHTGEERGQDPGTDPLSLSQREQGKQNQGGNGMTKNQQKQQPRDTGNQGGMNNREAAEELNSGSLKHQEPGMRSLNTNTRARAGQQQSSDTRSTRDDAEKRPAGATRSERPAAGKGNEIEPAHIPGTTGRPKRQRGTEIEDTEAGSVRDGEAAGSTRAVRVTNGNRKRKKVA